MTLQELSKLELEEIQCQIEAARMRRQIELAAPELLEALKEIAKGNGAFDHDPLKHAANVIRENTEIAKVAIAKATS